MSFISEALFHHYPWDDSPKVQKRIVDEEYGPHWFFRRVKSPTRARFNELMDNRGIPQAFLFGSPHIDNYAKTDTGCGMIDFDRAYIGPYAWDLVCLILSVSLRQKQYRFSLVDHKVLDALLVGYTKGLLLGEQPFEVYQPLATSPRKKWQKYVDKYVAENKKWAKKMNDCPVPNNDVVMIELMKQYCQNLSSIRTPQDYRLVQAGRCKGTFDRVHNILLIENCSDKSKMLIDVKHTRSYCNANWQHDQFYTSEYDHDGKRMIAASKIHAPGVTANESYATVNGVQYWGRSVPLQNRKIKKNLNSDELAAFCYAVGTQLGRSHGLSGKHYDIQSHVTSHFEDLSAICEQILHDIEAGWLNYQTMLELGSKR